MLEKCRIKRLERKIEKCRAEIKQLRRCREERCCCCLTFNDVDLGNVFQEKEQGAVYLRIGGSLHEAVNLSSDGVWAHCFDKSTKIHRIIGPFKEKYCKISTV